MILSTIFALAPQAEPGKPAPPAWMQLVPLGLMVVVFYFALIRPQQKKAKAQSELLKTVKAGDRIVTVSGIIATVITVKEKALSIRSADSKFEITKAAVAEILERNEEAKES